MVSGPSPADPVLVLQAAYSNGCTIYAGIPRRAHTELEHLAHRDLDKMSMALTNAIKGITDSVISCRNVSLPMTNATKMKGNGYCASEILGAATTAAAASVEVVSAKEACAGNDRALCSARVSATAMDLMFVGVHLTEAAKNCGATGNTECALQIENVFLLSSAAASMGSEAKVAGKTMGLDAVRAKVTVVGRATAAMVAALGDRFMRSRNWFA